MAKSPTHKKRSKSKGSRRGKKRSGSKKSKKRSKSKGSRKGRKKRSGSKKRRSRSLTKYQIYMRSALKKAGMKGKSRSARAAIFRKVAQGWSRA